MKLSIRKLTESDYDLLSQWWIDWGWTPIEKERLPEEGVGGVMVEQDGNPIIAGFMYWTNSKVVILDYIISNKKSTSITRQKALQSLIVTVEDMVEAAGCKYLFSFSQHEGLIKTHKKLGWDISKNNIYKIFKKINS